LTMTITAFGATSLEFGPAVLAQPLWALLLLHSWQLIGQGRRTLLGDEVAQRSRERPAPAELQAVDRLTHAAPIDRCRAR